MRLCTLPRPQARHCMHFTFSHGAQPDRPEPTLEIEQLRPFTAEIQRSGSRWHFPSSPDGAQWLCVQLPALGDEEGAEHAAKCSKTA